MGVVWQRVRPKAPRVVESLSQPSSHHSDQPGNTAIEARIRAGRRRLGQVPPQPPPHTSECRDTFSHLFRPPRLVVLVEGSPIAFNPKKPAGGWRLCVPTQTSQLLSLGESAMASVEWGDRLVVATGRGGERRCNVASLSFKYPPGDADVINGSDALLTTSSTSSDSAETSGVLLSVIVDR